MMNAFNPWVDFLAGQQASNSLTQAQNEGMDLRERLALKNAAGQLGSQNYFAGYEGVPGAERPEYLKQAWVGASPESAAKLEGLYSEPFKVKRSIQTAGEIEAAKKAADYNAMSGMIEDLGRKGMFGNQFARQMSGANTGPSVAYGGQVPGSGVMAPTEQVNTFTDNPSGAKTILKVDANGPHFTLDNMSEAERQNFASQVKERAEGSKQGQQKIDMDLLNNAHAQVRDAYATVDKLQERYWATGQGADLVAQAKQELDQKRAALNGILSGKDSSPAIASPQTPGVLTKPLLSDSEMAPYDPRGELSSGVTPKQKSELLAENKKDRIVAANKEIVNAREHALKIQQYMPQVKELFDIVTKQDIGHPAMEGLPLAENVLNMSRVNAQVHKLQGALTNMFAQPGQSQLMNTIVERTLQAASVPSLFAEPQLNKMNAAILRSNVEHLRNLPGFLEKWQKSHNGTLDGAADTWVGYVENNPLYTYKKDARGNVSVQANPNVKTLDTWMKGVRTIGGKTFIRQSDGSWMEQ